MLRLNVCLDTPLVDIRPTCVAGRTQQTLAGVGCLEAKGTGQVRDGRGSLHAWSTPALSAALWDLPDEAIQEHMLKEATVLLGRPIVGIHDSHLIRLPHGLPVFYPGWLKLLAARQDSIVPSGLTLAGDYLASPSIEGAVRSGQEAADRVYTWLKR